MTSYLLKTTSCTWEIESAAPSPGVILKIHRGNLRVPVNGFATAEEAAQAVGTGDTCLAEWDSLSHRESDFEIAKWSRQED